MLLGWVLHSPLHRPVITVSRLVPKVHVQDVSHKMMGAVYRTTIQLDDSDALVALEAVYSRCGVSTHLFGFIGGIVHGSPGCEQLQLPPLGSIPRCAFAADSSGCLLGAVSKAMNRMIHGVNTNS